MSVARTTAALVSFGSFALVAGASAQQSPAPAAPPAFETQVLTVEPIHAMVLPMKGSYLQHPDAFARLGTYLSTRGIKPTGAPFGRYFSDPSVGEANLVWEVGFPVAAGAAAEAPFEIRDVPAELSVVHVHKGPIEELGPAWGQLVGWAMSNGYQVSGAPTQVFKGDMTTSTEVEMRLPVTK
jgi:effector-binding domain-containing protein